MSWQNVNIKDLSLNPMTMISDEWCLIAAGNKKRGYNGMTASWGHLGALWGHGKGYPTASVYIRPQRYTKEFIDRENTFTLSVLGNDHKKQLAYMGSHSGRDGDKIAAAGLAPVFAEDTVYFDEARLVFICRKLYHAPLQESGFVDTHLIEENYPQRDFHEIYVGQIVKVLAKE